MRRRRGLKKPRRSTEGMREKAEEFRQKGAEIYVAEISS